MSRRPTGEDLFLSRLVTASNALLRLSVCPELSLAITTAYLRTISETDGEEDWQSRQTAIERWYKASPDDLVILANVLSCLATSDEKESTDG